MDSRTLETYKSINIEIKRLKMSRETLNSLLTELSLGSPSLAPVEGSNPNRNTNGISPKNIAVATRLNEVEGLIKARQEIINEVHRFLDFIEDDLLSRALTMRYIEGFSWEVIQVDLAYPRTTIRYQFQRELQKYNDRYLGF